MITLKNEQIRWSHEDVRLMSKIIGSEHAVVSRRKHYRTAPPLLSILKLAEKKDGLLSRRALGALEDAEANIAFVRKLKSKSDGIITDKEAAKYFKHQRADLEYLYRLRLPGVLLAHEAGVGKTLVSIRYAEFMRTTRRMIICPNAAKEQWADEIQRWGSSGEIWIVEGTIDQQIEIITTERDDASWIIGHWESLVHARDGWLDAPWDIAILDEAQHIGNRHAQRTDTVHSLKANVRMALTAHPYANGTNELFAILQFLYPDLYPGFWRWANMHIEIDEGVFGGLDLRTPRRPHLLQWEIEPFTMRRLWKDVWKNLPPITRVTRMAYLTPRGRAEYKRLQKQFFVELAALGTKQNILAIPSMLARVTRLRQYLIDPGLLKAKEPSVKYPIVHELIQELEGFPPVIFTMWRRTAIRLKHYLEKKKMKIGLIVGGMQSSKINKIKRRFVRGQYDAVIIMIKVGGTALNFGKYGKIIYLDHPWNQRDVEQTEGRVRRPEEGTGALVPATSYHIIVKDSYEERMRETRHGKHTDFAKVFTVAKAKEVFG